MPGIVGFCGPAAAAHHAAIVLGRMRGYLEHEAFYVLDEMFCDGHLACSGAHVDLHSHVPQPSSTGQVRVWLDGEIFNQPQLTKGLPSAPAGDALILAELATRDPSLGFLPIVDGSYTAVIYDVQGARITLAVDRYGSRPLYWTRYQDGLAWSTESKAFLGLPGSEPRIRRQAVDEFLELNYIPHNGSWFEGVERVPAAATLTWDQSTRMLATQRYWWWDRVKLLEPGFDEDEIAEELADRFVRSVARRVEGPRQAGLMLSGGIDSRSILAAMPQPVGPIEALTFGKRGCVDVRIARRAAALKRARIHVWEMTADNWLAPRIDGVWWAEASSSILDMNGIEARHLCRELLPICLSGGPWDDILRGYYPTMLPSSRPVTADALVRELKCRPELVGDIPAYAFEKPEAYLLGEYLGRELAVGPILLRTAVVHRQVYSDNALVEFAFSLPDHLRADCYIWRKALISKFPEFFRWVPDAAIGVPLGWPQSVRVVGKKAVVGTRRATQPFGRLAQRWSSMWAYADLGRWLRTEPSLSVVRKLLLDDDSLYGEYVPRRTVEAAFVQHQAGRDNSRMLGRYATLEIWLRQLFKGELRPDRGTVDERLG